MSMPESPWKIIDYEFVLFLQQGPVSLVHLIWMVYEVVEVAHIEMFIFLFVFKSINW